MVEGFVCSVCSDLVVIWWHRHFVLCSRHLSGIKSQPVPGLPGQRKLCPVPSEAQEFILKTARQSVLWRLAWGYEILEINPDKKNKIKSLALSKATNIAKFNAKQELLKERLMIPALPFFCTVV